MCIGWMSTYNVRIFQSLYPHEWVSIFRGKRSWTFAQLGCLSDSGFEWYQRMKEGATLNMSQQHTDWMTQKCSSTNHNPSFESHCTHLLPFLPSLTYFSHYLRFPGPCYSFHKSPSHMFFFLCDFSVSFSLLQQQSQRLYAPPHLCRGRVFVSHLNGWAYLFTNIEAVLWDCAARAGYCGGGTNIQQKPDRGSEWSCTDAK